MSEANEIARDGANPIKNSGRGYKKGDATLGPFTVDYKEYSKSYGVSQKTWGKICTDAISNSNQPALKLCIGEEEPKSRVWVISDGMFHQMLEAWEEKYG